MYEYIKILIKKLISDKFLFKHEILIRKIYSIRYIGNKYECNICNSTFSKFIRLKNNDLLCPYCGSLSRNRRLGFILEKKQIKGKILHFSPSRAMYRKMIKIYGNDYISTDYNNEFLASKNYNITNIELKNNCINLIICFHILEHIINDIRAMRELYRVLKNKGIAIIQTPFKNGEIYENFKIQDKKNRVKHFGQKDHVRIYSVTGLMIRLEESGFKVEILDFREENEQYTRFGLKNNEKVLVAVKD